MFSDLLFIGHVQMYDRARRHRALLQAADRFRPGRSGSDQPAPFGALGCQDIPSWNDQTVVRAAGDDDHAVFNVAYLATPRSQLGNFVRSASMPSQR